MIYSCNLYWDLLMITRSDMLYNILLLLHILLYDNICFHKLQFEKKMKKMIIYNWLYHVITCCTTALLADIESMMIQIITPQFKWWVEDVQI